MCHMEFNIGYLFLPQAKAEIFRPLITYTFAFRGAYKLIFYFQAIDPTPHPFCHVGAVVCC